MLKRELVGSNYASSQDFMRNNLVNIFDIHSYLHEKLRISLFIIKQYNL